MANQQSLAIPFRVIEVFTSKDTYASLINQEDTEKLLSLIWTHLVTKDYFVMLRNVLEKRVPEPYEETTKPPTPLAASILDMLIRPLNTTFEDRVTKSLILEKFFLQVSNGPFSTQFKNFAMPVILKSMPSNLKPSQILSSLLINDGLCLRMPQSIWSFYTFVKIIGSQIDSMTQTDRQNYLLALKHLAISFPEFREVSDEESDEPMDVRESIQHVDVNRLVTEILEVINEPKHVGVLLSMIDYQEVSGDALISLCKLCYSMIACDQLAVNRYR